MLDMYKTIRNAMQEREDKYISFPDLVDYLRSVNNEHVQDSIIGDYLLFIFKRFNPYEFGDKADFFSIYISMDLSDVTKELEISYDQEVFFKFAHSLCDGSFRNKDYWYFFLERKFVFNEINIDQQIHENLHNPAIDSTELQAEKAKNTQLQAENERLKAELKAQQDRMAELEQKLQQSAVDSEPVLEKCKAYDVRERETHLLMIGALSNLLAGYKQNYQKGSSGINQSAISRDIEHEIIQLLQPETKTRTLDTIRPRIREALNLITKAE